MKKVLMTALVAMSLMSILPAVAQAEAVDSNAGSAVDYVWYCNIVEIQTTGRTINVPAVGSVTVYGQNVCI